MDLTLLNTFRTIAEEGSFSRAAQRLLRTQPAVSLALKRLEKDLGTTLIDRSSKQLSLTDAGRLVLDYCERFDGVDRDLRTSLAELQDLESGRLLIGVNESAALYLLDLVVEFRKRHPRVHVELRRTLSSRIPGEIVRGSLEMGALSYDPGDDRIALQEIYQDHLAFVVSPQHLLAKRRKVSIEELGEETFIAHNVTGPYRSRIIETFQEHRVPLNIGIELPTIETIRRLVQRGQGVAFLPRMCVEQEIESRVLREVEVREIQMTRTIRLAYPAARRLSHAARAFLEIVAEA